MTTQVLSPTQLVVDGPGLDLTGALATPTGVTLQFANSGREFLAIAAATTSLTATVDIGVTVLGQSVTNFTTVNLTNAHTYLFGPFHAQLDQPGSQTVQVVLSSTTSISVALLQFVGVS